MASNPIAINVHMKAVILVGSLDSRISEETRLKPKPMIDTSFPASA